MSEKDPMMRFLSVMKSEPTKRSADQRRHDFREIEPLFEREKASLQASRCSQCGVPMCQVHCPLGNNIPDWLRAAASGRLKEAYQLASETNSMPEICGRICPQDRLCEGHCVIARGHGSVTIGAIEKYVTETAWEKGWVRSPTPESELPQSVGIIGAGPAGLAAAENLRRMGYQIHVYDRYAEPGGLLTYGIPSFKLEKSVVKRRIDSYREAGIHFHNNFEVGKTISFAELKERHNAMLIATGVYRPREIQISGAHLPQVIEALEYLIASNESEEFADLTKGIDASLRAEGKRVFIVGGGDTAMDCARTAIRQGAVAVTVLYRRNRESMPGSQKEVMHALEEGVEFKWFSAPSAYLGTECLEQIEVIKTQIGSEDRSGLPSVVPVPESAKHFPADLVIHALGYEPEDLPLLFSQSELKVSASGTIEVNQETLETQVSGVFAAGDIVRGASLVVWAIKDGRRAAESIHSYLQDRIN